jgi:hypothetical protein
VLGTSNVSTSDSSTNNPNPTSALDCERERDFVRSVDHADTDGRGAESASDYHESPLGELSGLSAVSELASKMTTTSLSMVLVLLAVGEELGAEMNIMTKYYSGASLPITDSEEG